jgi:hypothetical protein
MRFFFALLLLTSVCAHAGPRFAIVGGQATAKVPFEIIDNRVFIAVRINGQGPFSFILDTGASDFALSEETAAKLKLQVKSGEDFSGVGEKAVHSGQTHLATVRIGDLLFSDLDGSVFPTLEFGDVFGKRSLDGVVGLEVFQRVVARHDYVGRMLTFTLPEKFSYSGTGVIVHFELPQQIPVVDADLDGVHGSFGIDTGARSSLLIYAPFAAQNKLAEKYGAKLEGVTGWGIGGPVRSLLARAGALKIGGVSVTAPVIRLYTLKAGLTTTNSLAGLIGPDVLSQYDVTFDYARRRIIFEKNANYGRHDSYDHAGVWMGQAGDHFKALDVIAGGPAAEAGVKAGDIILAIDGVSTEKLLLPDVREKIRRKAVGNKLMLQLETDGKPHTAVVLLRDMV